jgi:hypothetical protein
VLKSVIEHDAIHRTCLKDLTAQPVSIGPDRHDSLRAALGNQIRLVSGLLRRGKCPRTVGHHEHGLATGSTVATAEHGDSLPGPEQPLGDLNDHRRLSRPADGEIPDTDDGNRKMSLRKPPL